MQPNNLWKLKHNGLISKVSPEWKVQKSYQNLWRLSQILERLSTIYENSTLTLNWKYQKYTLMYILKKSLW